MKQTKFRVRDGSDNKSLSVQCSFILIWVVVFWLQYSFAVFIDDHINNFQLGISENQFNIFYQFNCFDEAIWSITFYLKRFLLCWNIDAVNSINSNSGSVVVFFFCCFLMLSYIQKKNIFPLFGPCVISHVLSSDDVPQYEAHFYIELNFAVKALRMWAKRQKRRSLNWTSEINYWSRTVRARYQVIQKIYKWYYIFIQQLNIVPFYICFNIWYFFFNFLLHFI